VEVIVEGENGMNTVIEVENLAKKYGDGVHYPAHIKALLAAGIAALQ
jgi:hypothetical protein